jgi:hypothetical protein
VQTSPVQCYIKRVRSGFQKLWPYYVLYSQDPDKFLLSGRRRKKNKQSTYLISSDEKVSQACMHACVALSRMRTYILGSNFRHRDRVFICVCVCGVCVCVCARVDE